jgi:osmotically inducible lipoprotein OsmB
MIKRKCVTMFALAALTLGVTTISAEAANCQGRRDTGTAVGAIGGGVLGNAASRGSAGGTIAGAVIGGLAGNLIGGNCAHRYSYNSRYERHGYYDARGYDNGRGVAFYYDRFGHRHYYR